MPRASSTSGKKMLLWLSFAIIVSSFLRKKKWHGKFSLSGCHLLSYFHHSVGEIMTRQIQLIWLSFAFIFSAFCWEKSDMADSAYLAVHLSSSFHHFCGGKRWHGSFSFSGCHLPSSDHHFVEEKQTWQIQDGFSDSKYMLLAYFFLGI